MGMGCKNHAQGESRLRSDVRPLKKSDKSFLSKLLVIKLIPERVNHCTETEK